MEIKKYLENIKKETIEKAIGALSEALEEINQNPKADVSQIVVNKLNDANIESDFYHIIEKIKRS